MGGSKCVYFQCNKTKREFPQTPMFIFPVRKDPERAKKWVYNSGNTSLLDLTVEALARRALCADHFKSTEIFNMSNGRKGLSRLAIPKPYVPEEETFTIQKVYRPEKPLRDYSREKKIIDPAHVLFSENSFCSSALFTKQHDLELDYDPLEVFKMPDNNVNVNKQRRMSALKYKQMKDIEKLKVTLQQQTKMLKSKRSMIYKLKRKLEKKELALTEDPLMKYHFKSENSKILAGMQLMKNKSFRKEWSLKEKQLAITLYCKSPTMYKILIEEEIVLPSVNTVASWLGELAANVFNDNCKENENCDIIEDTQTLSSGQLSSSSSEISEILDHDEVTTIEL